MKHWRGVVAAEGRQRLPRPGGRLGMVQKTRPRRGPIAAITNVKEEKRAILSAQRTGVVRFSWQRNIALREGVHRVRRRGVVDLRDSPPPGEAMAGSHRAHPQVVERRGHAVIHDDIAAPRGDRMGRILWSERSALGRV